MKSKAGFTLVELLVSIAVIGLLIALLLPAVQQARESARLSMCRSHLKQLGIALHSYHDSARVFPLLMYPTEGGTFWDWRGFSPQTMLLPYVEESNLYDQLDFNSWALDPQNHNVALRKIALYRCPSDLETNTADPGINYAFCLGANVGFSSDGVILSAQEQNGVITGTVRRTMGHITDGTSNVIAASEQIVGGKTDSHGQRADFRYAPGSIPSGMSLSFPSQGELFLWAETCETFLLRSDRVASQWHRGLPGQTTFNTLLTPNSSYPNCSIHCFNNCDSDGAGLYTARSRHRGGVNCLMADGSVRFLSDNIDLLLWQRLGAVNDGNSIELP